MFRKLDDAVSVAGQISVDDVAEAARQGFVAIVNNRPDDEQPGQPSGAEIEAAAKANGLSYRAIPITHAGFSTNQVDAMVEALSAAQGPLLAFCRSGTRSAFVCALAHRDEGMPSQEVEQRLVEAGFDPGPIAHLL